MITIFIGDYVKSLLIDVTIQKICALSYNFNYGQKIIYSKSKFNSVLSTNTHQIPTSNIFR